MCLAFDKCCALLHLALTTMVASPWPCCCQQTGQVVPAAAAWLPLNLF